MQMLHKTHSLLAWPGKSADPDSRVRHPAVYHMLDVAAVADVLLRRADFAEPVHQALVLLTALHDIGKIGNRFRVMIEEGETQGDRHWEVSMAWFSHFDADVLGQILGSDAHARMPLYAAAAGHHGGPPDGGMNGAGWRRMVKNAGDEAARDALAVIEVFAELFPDAALGDLELDFDDTSADWRKSAHAISWWLNGLVSAADWVGSNTTWFPATSPDHTIDEYWQLARNRASLALDQSGLVGATPSKIPTTRLLAFDALTPMQQAVLDAGLPSGPMAAVIEDATGSGKTEAALMLAHRMMQAGKGEGLFFALPTMATANAMFPRLAAMGAMFEGKPSLALTHSRAWLHKGFQELQGRTRGEPDEMAVPNGLPMVAEKRCWPMWGLAQSTRRCWVCCQPDFPGFGSTGCHARF